MFQEGGVLLSRPFATQRSRSFGSPTHHSSEVKQGGSRGSIECPVLEIGALAYDYGGALACERGNAVDAQALAEIDAARTAFWDAHEQGDAAVMAEFLTEDAPLWGPGREEVSGRAAIREAAEEMFAVLSISEFKIESKEVQLHDGLAYEIASYSETLTPKSGQASVVRGRYLIVWKRGPDGRWRVHRNMFHFITSNG